MYLCTLILIMKRFSFFIGALVLMMMASCQNGSKDKVLLTRDFHPSGWERFDFITDELDVKQPTTYDITMKASFDDSYTADYFSVVFTVFDSEDQPLRAKNYKFSLKEKDGTWKSDLKDGLYTFTFPINSEMSFNEPGRYILQLENHMPITPLIGIRHISLRTN